MAADDNTEASHFHQKLARTNIDPVHLRDIIIETLVQNPKLLDDKAKSLVVEFYKTNQIDASDFITPIKLAKLLESKTQAITWIKYESLLCHLIRAKVYSPKCLMDEVLALSKQESFSQEAGSKFASCLSQCVKCCREISNPEEEEEQKWCEIIDWMSWFLADPQDDGDL